MRASTADPSASGFVVRRRGQFHVDRDQKIGSIIAGEILVDEVGRFLSTHFMRGADSLLDLGAGAKPYAPLYEPHFQRCVAVDVPHSLHDVSGVDAFASADALPYGDESFDCVLCTEVVEHCPDPLAVFKEIHRVLKPGGRALVTTPFLVPLHEMPYDYWRFTPSALQLLAQGAGLEVESLRTKGEYVAVVIEMVARGELRAWRLLSKVARVDLARRLNPFVYVGVVAPQLAYLALWRRAMARPDSRAAHALEKASYTTLGYMTVLARRG